MTSENNQNAFDAGKAEAFSEKLLTALNYGSLSLMGKGKDKGLVLNIKYWRKRRQLEINHQPPFLF